MAHYRKKRPQKTIGNKCMLCQWRQIVGNSRKDLPRQVKRADEAERCQREALHEARHR